MPRACSEVEELVLPSQLEALERVDQTTLRCTKRAGFGEKDAMMVAIAVVEAVTNAIVHGNKYSGDKSVKVEYRCYPGGISVVVQDEGTGFDLSCVWDPTTPDRCLECSGRGIYIMRQVMDAVEFEMNGGTRVTMRKSA
jgi:serine/threonine-protein kinase RsbW